MHLKLNWGFFESVHQLVALKIGRISQSLKSVYYLTYVELFRGFLTVRCFRKVSQPLFNHRQDDRHQKLILFLKFAVVLDLG